MLTKALTQQELARHNGRDGAPVFVAYNGQIYDVSTSFLWQTGVHQALHLAGTDSTDSLAQAPHGPEMLARFPIVGTLNTNE